MKKKDFSLGLIILASTMLLSACLFMAGRANSAEEKTDKKFPS